MNIFVCVKQVPDTAGRVAVKPDGTMDRASMKTIINPNDLSAVEAALRLKDETGCRVIVLTMGPPKAAEMLDELRAMGADEAVLITAREFGGSDTYATSQILAAAIDTLGLTEDDLILCGQQAIDGDTAQVGPQIAEKLHLPLAGCIAALQVKDGTVTVKRMLEDGYMTLAMHTPCLCTCLSELAAPRYMTVKGILHCDDEPIRTLGYEALKDHALIDATTIGLKGSPTNVYKSFAPPVRKGGRVWEGNEKQAARELISLLNEQHLL